MRRFFLLASLPLLLARAAAAAADGWTHLCDSCAAVGADCPFLDHGAGGSLAACQASCEAEAACNAINVDAAISDCVLRACADPRNVSTQRPYPGYSVYTLASRPVPPPGCWPSPGGGGGGGGDASPPASWAAAVARGDRLFLPRDDALDPQYDQPQLGNGFLATQAMTGSLFVAGLFNGFSTQTPSHRARIPAPHAVPAPSGNVTAAAWDSREATYYRRSSIDPTPEGAPPCSAASNVTCTTSAQRVWVEQRFYAHRALPSVLVMEIEVLEADEDASGSGGGGSGPASTAPAAAPFAVLQLRTCPSANSSDIDFAPVALGPPDSELYSVVNGSTLVPEINASSLQGVAVLTTAWPQGGMLIVAAPRETSVFLAVVRTTVETAAADLVDAVQADWQQAQALVRAGTLHASHLAEMEATIWAAGVELDGREDLARIANASLSAIAGSMREDRHFAPSSSGLSGAGDSQTGYNGHVFWDNSLWWGPVMATMMPDLAAGLLAYRLERLNGAEEKARSYDPPFAGVMFPWESALTGQEMCPSWAPTGLREIHISGDVSVFAWWLFRMQQQNNLTWLGSFYPLFAGVANFWVSRASGGGSGGALSIDDVIPPDEYADHVNNSAFTNAVAKLALRQAAKAAALLGVDAANASAWLAADAALSLPFDAIRDYHPEYDGYVIGTTIKQADVVMLGFPLMHDDATMTAASRRQDLDTYFAVSDPGGPAMTWAMHAIGFAELGNATAAGEMLNLTVANAGGPFGVWRETPSGGCPNFITGAAGFLQALIFGYPRLRLNDSSLTFSSPMLVDGSTSLRLRGLAFLGNRLDVSYNAATIEFSLQSSAACSADGRPAGSTRRRYAAAGAGVGAGAGAGAGAGSESRGLLPARNAALQLRSTAPCQHGRVAFAGAIVEPRALVVVTESDGRRHALAPGFPLALPVADVFVIAAADAARVPLAGR